MTEAIDLTIPARDRRPLAATVCAWRSGNSFVEPPGCAPRPRDWQVVVARVEGGWYKGGPFDGLEPAVR